LKKYTSIQNSNGMFLIFVKLERQNHGLVIWTHQHGNLTIGHGLGWSSYFPSI